MQAKSYTLEIGSDYNTAFDYIADMRNLREWAPQFCLGVKNQNGHLIANTPMGDLYLRTRTDKAMGIIDMYANPTPEGEEFMPSRLYTAPNGRTIFVLTYIREKGISDEEFAGHCVSIEKDLERIKQKLS